MLLLVSHINIDLACVGIAIVKAGDNGLVLLMGTRNQIFPGRVPQSRQLVARAMLTAGRQMRKGAAGRSGLFTAQEDEAFAETLARVAVEIGGRGSQIG